MGGEQVVNNPCVRLNNFLQDRLAAAWRAEYMVTMTEQERKMPGEIEVYEVGARRLYAKTRDRSFALFEDELTPEELMAIARDIAARRAKFLSPGSLDQAAA